MAHNRLERFELRLASDERAWLDALAERDGVSGADVLRRLLRAEARATLDAPLEVQTQNTEEEK